jgi:hypothetical protein
MKLRLFFLCLLVAAATSAAGQHLTLKNYQGKMTRSLSLIRIDKQQYCDSKPITNLDWREYLYWLERIYGKESEPYRAALPDEAVLQQQLPDSIATNYLWQPAYNGFTVLGVSPEQARAYCQWRTDRVAEYILVGMKIREWNPDNPFFLANYDNPQNLQFLHFFLPQEGMETRYGFFCFAMWK